MGKGERARERGKRKRDMINEGEADHNDNIIFSSPKSGINLKAGLSSKGGGGGKRNNDKIKMR